MSTQAAVQIKNLTMAQELMAAKRPTPSAGSRPFMHDLKTHELAAHKPERET
jgi:hypothetical protein